MEMRKLGHDGPLVSKIGLGGVAMSDLYGHDRNDEESLATLHAAIDAGVTLVVSKTPEEATNHFGWFAHFEALDNPASSQRTRELLGWQPKQPGLISDIDRRSYFEA